MIEIYFDDLTPAMQKILLSAYQVNSPNEMNWDVLPVTYVSVEG